VSWIYTWGDLTGGWAPRSLARMRTNRIRHVPATRLGVAAAFAALLCLAPIAAANAAGKSRTCFGKHPTILGTQHSDSIRGTSGVDVIISLGGNDHIRSRQGNDYVCAGPGDDVVHGAEDVNHMNGGPGNDWLDGRRGPGNVSIGSRGNDLIQAEGKIQGGPGDDAIESFGYLDPSASPFADVTNGGTGKDKISGGDNAELLIGGGDNDKIFAGDGDDNLEGKSGNDKLHGELGNDNIDGGLGTDVCDQGPGSGTLTGCP
jgi:Ca2+-binding RTX toxin-like protein